jgi:hypothetical protein
VASDFKEYLGSGRRQLNPASPKRPVWQPHRTDVTSSDQRGLSIDGECDSAAQEREQGSDTGHAAPSQANTPGRPGVPRPSLQRRLTRRLDPELSVTIDRMLIPEAQQAFEAYLAQSMSPR